MRGGAVFHMSSISTGGRLQGSLTRALSVRSSFEVSAARAGATSILSSELRLPV
jgi:hypothetical protein